MKENHQRTKIYFQDTRASFFGVKSPHLYGEDQVFPGKDHLQNPGKGGFLQRAGPERRNRLVRQGLGGLEKALEKLGVSAETD